MQYSLEVQQNAARVIETHSSSSLLLNLISKPIYSG